MNINQVHLQKRSVVFNKTYQFDINIHALTTRNIILIDEMAKIILNLEYLYH